MDVAVVGSQSRPTPGTIPVSQQMNELGPKNSSGRTVRCAGRTTALYVVRRTAEQYHDVLSVHYVGTPLDERESNR
jgi:hypothetical protein